MRNAAIAIVLLGLALSLGLALVVGLDVMGAVILLVLAGTGALAIAVSRKSATGAVNPAECASCGGLISPNAPYCKHCGAPVPTGTS